MDANGGIASYVQRLGTAQEARGLEVKYLSDEGMNEWTSVHAVEDGRPFVKADDLNLDLLHLHHPVGNVPEDRVPTIRTVHTNHGSCPSGTRYLKRFGEPCDRDYSVPGCLWGHLVDHCGSRRPHKTFSNFRHIHREQEQAAIFPTLTVSTFLKERMIQSGCAPENLHVLHSPAPNLDTSFSPVERDDPPHFVFAGRITPMKGVDWLLRSFAEVKTNVHLDVAGTGNDEYMEELAQLASDLDIQREVTFHGWVDESEVYSLIRRARALVFPSVWHEPAGLVTLEAAALGRPVIASDVGGIPEYAREEFATLVDARDVHGLAWAIERLAKDADDANRRGRRARRLAQSSFSMQRFLERLHQFYRSTDACP
jgi:glycosyltransferase involved in cell wall biosynthesis